MNPMYVVAPVESQSLPTDQGSSDYTIFDNHTVQLAVEKSQSLPTDQGSSDPSNRRGGAGACPRERVAIPPYRSGQLRLGLWPRLHRGFTSAGESQSLPTDQGSSDGSWIHQVGEQYPPVAIPPYRSGQLRRSTSPCTPWRIRTGRSRNPSLPIRAAPTQRPLG